MRVSAILNTTPVLSSYAWSTPAGSAANPAAASTLTASSLLAGVFKRVPDSSAQPEMGFPVLTLLEREILLLRRHQRQQRQPRCNHIGRSETPAHPPLPRTIHPIAQQPRQQNRLGYNLQVSPHLHQDRRLCVDKSFQ